MAGLPVTLSQLAHLLPPHQRARARQLDVAGAGVTVRVVGERRRPSFALEGEVCGYRVHTDTHAHLGAEVVREVVERLEAAQREGGGRDRVPRSA